MDETGLDEIKNLGRIRSSHHRIGIETVYVSVARTPITSHAHTNEYERV